MYQVPGTTWYKYLVVQLVPGKQYKVPILPEEGLLPGADARKRRRIYLRHKNPRATASSHGPAMCSHTESHSVANGSAAWSERMLPATLHQLRFGQWTSGQQQEEGRVNACAAVIKECGSFYLYSALLFSNTVLPLCFLLSILNRMTRCCIVECWFLSDSACLVFSQRYCSAIAFYVRCDFLRMFLIIGNCSNQALSSSPAFLLSFQAG